MSVVISATVSTSACAPTRPPPPKSPMSKLQVVSHKIHI
jgi:hypothetical protein